MHVGAFWFSHLCLPFCLNTIFVHLNWRSFSSFRLQTPASSLQPKMPQSAQQQDAEDARITVTEAFSTPKDARTPKQQNIVEKMQKGIRKRCRPDQHLHALIPQPWPNHVRIDFDLMLDCCFCICTRQTSDHKIFGALIKARTSMMRARQHYHGTDDVCGQAVFVKFSARGQQNEWTWSADGAS